MKNAAHSFNLVISYWNKLPPERVSSYSLNVICTTCASLRRAEEMISGFFLCVNLFFLLPTHPLLSGPSSSLSSFLILISIPTFVTSTNSSSLCSLLFQVISKYINWCWHWYRLPVLPEYFFQQCKSSHHISYQSASKWILTFGEKNFSTTTSAYGSLWDVAAKAYSQNLCPQSFESSPSVRKSEYSYSADVKVCHKRPMSRCTKPLNA